MAKKVGSGQVGRHRVNLDLAKRIRDMHFTGGVSQSQLVEEGFDPRTVKKYIEMSEEEFDDLEITISKPKIEKPLDDELVGKALRAKGKPASTATPHTIRRAVEHEITTRATDDLAKVLRLGNFCIRNLSEIARRRRMPMEELIKLSIIFYLTRKNELEKLQRQNEFYKLMLTHIIEISRPEAQRRLKLNSLKEIMTIHLAKGIKPNKTVYDTFIRELMDK